ADLVHEVVVLVAAVDGAAGARVGADVVNAIRERLALAEVEAVLRLCGKGARLVNDRLAGAQQVGAAEVQAVFVAGVAQVHERLGEEAAGAQARLEALDGPSLHLRGTVGAGELDGTCSMAHTVRVDPFRILGELPVEAGFAAILLHVEVARVRLPYARARRVR